MSTTSGMHRGARSLAARGLSLLALLAVAGLAVTAAIAPQGSADALASNALADPAATQELDGIVAAQLADDPRDSFGSEAAPDPVTVAAATAPIALPPTDPKTAQGIGYPLAQQRGWDGRQWSCLVALWNRESHWNVYAGNPTSGAYGIPQAVPGDRMAVAGADWKSDAATQIEWGLAYIASRYGNPCAAWAHSQSSGWY